MSECNEDPFSEDISQLSDISKDKQDDSFSSNDTEIIDYSSLLKENALSKTGGSTLSEAETIHLSDLHLFQPSQQSIDYSADDLPRIFQEGSISQHRKPSIDLEKDNSLYVSSASLRSTALKRSSLPSMESIIDSIYEKLSSVVEESKKRARSLELALKTPPRPKRVCTTCSIVESPRTKSFEQ